MACPSTRRHLVGEQLAEDLLDDRGAGERLADEDNAELHRHQLEDVARRGLSLRGHDDAVDDQLPDPERRHRDEGAGDSQQENREGVPAMRSPDHAHQRPDIA